MHLFFNLRLINFKANLPNGNITLLPIQLIKTHFWYTIYFISFQYGDAA